MIISPTVFEGSVSLLSMCLGLNQNKRKFPIHSFWNFPNKSISIRYTFNQEV